MHANTGQLAQCHCPEHRFANRDLNMLEMTELE
jgi:hypothetical protein